MKGKTVEQSDLTGKIKDFPVEVVQAMVNEQIRQKGKADISEFQECLYTGFSWEKALDGYRFWDGIIDGGFFDIFFKKYPKIKLDVKSINIKVPDGYEIDNDKSTFTNIVFKSIESKYPSSWDEAFIGSLISGCFIGDGHVLDYDTVRAESNDCNIFKTGKQAKSALAYAQITQLMALPCYNGYWEPDWNDNCQVKYTIFRCIDRILKSYTIVAFSPLSFQSPWVRDVFMKNHEYLIKQYFQLD